MKDKFDYIDLGNGIKVSPTVLEAALLKVGHCIAPIPAAPTPPQTETERLVEIATRLPEEVWVGSGWTTPHVNQWGNATLFGDPDWIVFKDDQFRTILLGVMAAYVGTEPGAYVVIGRNRVVIWTSCVDDACHNAPDLLTAYCDCCLAIHSRRSGNDK